MTTTPNIGLTYLDTGQAQKEATHNDALNDIDALLMLRILDRDLATPPAALNTGDCYLVAASPTGLWAGQTGKLACYYGGWKFKTPGAGWRAWIVDEAVSLLYNGTAWVSAGGASSGGGGIATALGTAAAPTLSYAGDPDTGFYSDGSDSLRAVTNGAEGWRLSPAGAFSVGTTSAPLNAAKCVLTASTNVTPYAQIGNSWRSLFFGSTYDAGSLSGTGYLGFNLARGAANSWACGTDGSQNGAGLIDCSIAGALRLYARASTGGTAGAETDSSLPNYLRMTVGDTSTIGGDQGSETIRVIRTASQVNRMEHTGTTAGNPPTIATAGADSNIDLRLSMKGTGRLRVDTNVANVVTTVGAAGGASALPATPTGYLRISINGTIRKLPFFADS